MKLTREQRLNSKASELYKIVYGFRVFLLLRADKDACDYRELRQAALKIGKLIKYIDEGK